MSTPFIGQLTLVGFNFAPIGWAMCDGRLLPISQYEALYNLIGTTYGGDGISTFAVPDLRGRLPIGMGQGPGLQNYSIGMAAGVEQVTLTVQTLPNHTHVLKGTSDPGNSNSPGGGSFGSGQTAYIASPALNAHMSPLSTTATGGSQPHENRQPYLTMTWVIALEGIYPTQG